MHRIIRRFKKGGKRGREINPEDIFIDSANLPNLNLDRLEGRIEKPIGEGTFLFLKVVFVFIFVFLSGRLWILQVSQGYEYKEISEENRLTRSIIFANRGVIFDRNSLPLAQNSSKLDENDFAQRIYAEMEGLAASVGFIKYPSKDRAGNYYDEEYKGQSGIEKMYEILLAGKNGSKLTETDALGNLTSESVVVEPVHGRDLYLSIDAKLTQKLYQTIKSTALERGFTGGAGVMMDVNTGEILALTSYPEYDQNLVTAGTDKAEIARLLSHKSTPFLNRAVSGLYTPGSIVKPIVALGALEEGIISPTKQILSTGALTLPNPYNPNNPSIFRDWKAHGWVDMIDALAVSSDVYFYEVGGGFEDQKGLGITLLDNYFSLFGLSEKTGIDLPGEEESYIATPSWKTMHFPDDPDWRIGNTYHTAIGQYGTQITPIAGARFVSALANGGKVLNPSMLLGGRPQESRIARELSFDREDYEIVQRGMREAVTRGTASGLSTPGVKIAAKTGTAELGLRKEFVNSWVVGFFPYESPRYAFVVIMEKGPVKNTVGGVYVMRQVLDWMVENTPGYLDLQEKIL